MDTLSSEAVPNPPDHSAWPTVLEGVLLALFGLVAIVWPGITVYSFTIVFGLYALFAGVMSVIGGIMNIRRGWPAIGTIILGILLVAAGSYVIDHPNITALTLVLFIGFTFIIKGIFEIVSALANNYEHKALAIISGILGVLVGIILLRYPLGGGLAYVWVIGIYALVSGPMLIARGLGAGRANR